MINFKNQSSAFMLFLILFWLAVQFGMTSFFAILNEVGYSISASWTLWITILMLLVGLLLPLIIWLKMTNDGFRCNMPNRPLGIVNFLLVVVIGFVVQPIAMFISSIFSLFFVNDAAAMLNAVADQPWWLMMLAIAVTPGIVEELVFRGYIQTKTTGGIAKVAILNGFLFGIMHLSPHQFMYTFVLGVLFAYMVYFTKSIWAGIIPHFILNGTQVTLAYFAPTPDSAGEAYAVQEFAQGLYDAFVISSPDFARQVYEWALGLDIMVIAIFSVGLFAIFAGFVLAGVMVVFVAHNRKRKLMFEAYEADDKTASSLLSSVAEGLAADPHCNGGIEKTPIWKRIDWCLVGVVGIYILVVVEPLFA